MSDQLMTVPIDQIEIEDGHNAREEFEPKALETLTASIKEHGLIQPLVVRPGENGGYVLVAGERRFRSAKLAELIEVPVVAKANGSAKAIAAAENLERQDLNPIETARALELLATAERLRRHEDLAKRVNRSTSWVSEHLRLLKLPEGVQKHIASGSVPAAAQKVLREIASVSERVAECCCEIVATGEAEAVELIEAPGSVVSQLAGREFDPPLALVAITNGATIPELVADTAVGEELTRRVLEARADSFFAESDHLRFEAQDTDAIRAAGALLELQSTSEWYTYRFATDKAVTQEVATRIVERIEREATGRRKAQEKAAKETGEDGTPKSPEEARREEREQAKREREAARDSNLALGAALLERKTAKARKDYALGRAKAVGKLVLADNALLPAAGLRLCMTQMQEVTTKTLKSGESRKKVSHCDHDRAREYVADQIDRAKTANEVLEVLADLLIAGLEVDQNELAASRQVNCWMRSENEVRAELAPEIKEVRPRRRRVRKS